MLTLTIDSSTTHSCYRSNHYNTHGYNNTHGFRWYVQREWNEKWERVRVGWGQLSRHKVETHHTFSFHYPLGTYYIR
jgi:hypothetical protein